MKILDKLTEKKQNLDALKPKSSEAIAEFLGDLEVKFIYHSNAISGSKMTLSTTKTILDGQQTHNETDEALAVLNQKNAIDYIVKLAQEKTDIKPENLIHVNELVVKGIDSANAGKYVKNEVILHKMDDFFAWYNKNKNNYHPVELAARVSGELKKINPFIKDNGKTSRLILNLELLKNEYPITIIGINGSDLCRDALDKIYKTNDYSDYINLLASYVLRSFNKYFDLIEGRNWEDKNYEHEFVL